MAQRKTDHSRQTGNVGPSRRVFVAMTLALIITLAITLAIATGVLGLLMATALPTLGSPPQRESNTAEQPAPAATTEIEFFPNTEPASSGHPMPPIAAAEAFTMPDGFSASVFASEPEVQNPIAMSWDSRGRLWVAENYTYAERSQRFDLSLRDRVVIFDGTGGDQFSSRTIFTDNVQMLTGIEVVDDGVYLMCPPRLLFIADADHDDVPDGPAEILLDGFTVAENNYHTFANGIRFGPDGWLYGRCGVSCPGRIGVPGTPAANRASIEGGIWRYHPIHRSVEVLTHGGTNPWGHDFNRDGQMFFVNTVIGHLWHMIPGAHYERPFTVDPNRLTYDVIHFHADHYHYDTTGSWQDSRDGSSSSLGGGHAHSGCLIYNDDAWPAKYQGKLWTLNFHGRRINQETLRRRGAGYVATHDPDFVSMADPWFRGIELSTGPDGNVFVLDWSDAGECHEHDGVHRTSGRIFKIKHNAAPERLVRDPEISQWWRQQTWKRLASGGDAAEDSGAITAENSGPVFIDFDPGLIDPRRVPDPHERAAAIREITDHWPIDDALGSAWKSDVAAAAVAVQSAIWIDAFVEAAKSDPSSIVRLTLASTLQRLPIEHRAVLAAALASRTEDTGDPNQPRMIWYGVMELLNMPDDSPLGLIRVAEDCRLPITMRLIARGLAERIQTHPQSVDSLLAIDFENERLRRAVLDGLNMGLRGYKNVAMPATWGTFRKPFSDHHPVADALSVLFNDGRVIDDLMAVVKGDQSPVDDAARAVALETLIAAGVDGLEEVCLSQLKNPRLNLIAARGLATFDDPNIGRILTARYRNFRSPTRPALISILVSRRAFAHPLLAAIESGEIDRSALSAFDVRQIHSLDDEALSAKVTEVWGEVRETSRQASEQIDSLAAFLTPARLNAANKSNGRVHFNSICKSCHQLYGEGERIGPDLTGGGRANLDYLLTNILAPSAVIDRDYRLSVVVTDDGRVINGVVVDQGPQTIQIQTATELLTIPLKEIESRRMTDQSPMPSGLLQPLSKPQIAELIAYLQHPNQVPLPPGKL